MAFTRSYSSLCGLHVISAIATVCIKLEISAGLSLSLLLLFRIAAKYFVISILGLRRNGIYAEELKKGYRNIQCTLPTV